MDADELAEVEARVGARLPYDDEASTITLVAGAGLREVLEAFGGDPGTPPMSLEDERWDEDWDSVALYEFPGGVAAVEFNGYEGARDEVLRRLSARGRAASAYWSIGSASALSLAESGRVLYSEPLEHPDLPADPVLARLFAGTDFGWETRLGSAVTVLERFTGVRIEGPTREGPVLLHRLAPHLSDRPTREPGPDEPSDPYRSSQQADGLAHAFGELAARQITAAVQAAPVPVRRGLTAYAVRRALRAAGMEHHPDVRATIDTLEGDPAFAPETELLIRYGTHVGYNVTATPATHALRAIDAAVNGDSVAAALGALSCTSYAIEAAAQVPDGVVGRRIMAWEWDELPSPRAAYVTARDRRAFLEEVFARLGVAPEEGALPALPEPPAEAPAGPWTAVAPWPYAPWDRAMTAWTGAEALVFGTRDDRARIPRLVPYPTGDGAGAYDPARDRWRTITPPPFAWQWGEPVMRGWVMYVVQHRLTERHRACEWDAVTGYQGATEIWAYSVPGDTWRQIAPPPGDIAYPSRLSVAGPMLVLWSRSSLAGESPVWLYDPAAGSWRPAPPSPFEDPGLRHVLGLPDGRVVQLDAPPMPFPESADLVAPAWVGEAGAVEAATQAAIVAAVAAAGHWAAPDAEDGTDDEFQDDDDYQDDDGEYEPGDEVPLPAWRAAVLDAGGSTWRVLPPAPVAAGFDSDAEWVLARGRVVCARRGTSRMLTHDDPSGAVPAANGGVLDVDAGRWEALPDLPGLDPGEPVRGENTLRELAGGGVAAVRNGWAYDPERRVWIQLPEIPGRAYGLASPAVVWAGDRVFVFANAAVEAVPGEPFEARGVPVREGWCWQPLP